MPREKVRDIRQIKYKHQNDNEKVRRIHIMNAWMEKQEACHVVDPFKIVLQAKN